MKKLLFGLIQTAIVLPQFAFAADFYHEGIRITLPGVMEEQIQGTPREEHVRYRIKLKESTQAAGTQAEIFIRIDRNDSYASKGAENAALSCLGMVMLEMPEPQENVRQLSQPRPLQIDGRTAMSFTMVHAGKFATDSWSREMVTRASYCLVEPDRSILIQLIAPVDGPQDIFAGSLKGIESLKLSDKK